MNSTVVFGTRIVLVARSATLGGAAAKAAIEIKAGTAMDLKRMLVILSLGLLLGPSVSCTSGHAARTARARGVQTTLTRHEYARVLMGSRCRIVVFARSEPRAAEACAAAFDRVHELGQILSDYNPVSEASLLVREAPGIWHGVSPDLGETLRKSLEIAEATGGAFDPSIGPLTKLWRAAQRDGALPDPAVLEAARSRCGYRLIDLNARSGRARLALSGMGLDFGGIGKGLAADEALSVLRDHGVPIALIDFGGDLRAGDPPPGRAGWAVEVRDGLGGTRPVTLRRGAIATSGDIERFIEIGGRRYSHILDPRRGFGVERRVAATVIASEGWLADALASAACVVGPEGIDDLRRRFPDATIEISVGGE